MTFITLRRRFLILLVPIVNFIFLALYIFSPSSLPRLPRSLSLLSQQKTVVLSEPEAFEFINFDKKSRSEQRTEYGSAGSIIDIVLGTNGNADTNSDSETNSGADTGAGSESGSESTPPSGPGSRAAPGSDGGFVSLLEQRKLVEGIELTPLPDHLITTYRPGYLSLLPTSSAKETPADNQGSDPEEDKARAREQLINLDPSTKFLTFLPHSGFHNQRTELENALLLAKLLNRTLIMPKVYLGPPMPWLMFSQLHSRLLYQTKIGLEHCRAIIENQEEEEVEVVEYEKVQEQVLQAIQQPQQRQQQQGHHHHHHHHHHHSQPNRQGKENSDVEAIQKVPDQGSGYNEATSKLNVDNSASAGYHNCDEESEDDEEPYNAEDNETDQESNRTTAESTEDDEIEEEEEIEAPSWIEEPEEEGEGRNTVATGDFVGDPLDIGEPEQDVQDWETIKEDEGEEEEEEEEEEEDYEDDEDSDGIQMGIIDDLDEDKADWEPESFVTSDHGYDGKDMNQMLWQQLDDEASLPLYMPLMDSNIGENIPRIRKRYLSHELQPNNIRKSAAKHTGREKHRAGIQKRLARLQKRQMQAQRPFRNIHDEQAPSSQDRQPSLPQVPQQVPVVRKQRRVKWTPLPAECLQYESWTSTDWDLFFDLNPLRPYVRILTRESISMAYLAERFNFTFPKEEEVNAPKGNETTSDASESNTEGGSAMQADQEDRSGGDVEGNGEEEDEPKKAPLLRTAGDVLFFDDTSLYDYRFTESPDAAESIRTRARFGQEFTIDWLAQRPERLIHLGSIFGTGRTRSVEVQSRALHHRQSLQEQLRQQQEQKEQQEHPFSQDMTPKRRSNGRYTPIYLATDAYRPRANPIFDKLFATFECIFTLDDFPEDLELLYQFRNPEDGTLMAKFMIPMVDTMVVAKSAAFFGTPASTFSNYIQRQLRPAYTGLYD
ncbi:hypothetical protein BGX26_005157 [Mortierella sp. AD094]|nr:hypothetical protein BGX26_005157 [Mortierella sp. AD094]